MIKGEYDEKVDVWALGVITYLLLSGDPPFGGMDGEALLTVRQNILDCNLKFEPNDIWDNISDTAKKFVSRLLTEDPNERPSAAEAQKDEWLTVCANMDPTQSAPLNTKLINNLLAFKDFSNLHKILLEVVSFTLLPGQIKGLKSEFEKIDRDGRGEITLDDLKEVLLNRVETGNLGSLTTEDDVEAIFDSLRLKKTETTIHWHEFIAAAVSRADYDNRNLRLAFNRFDHSGKG
jgi:calcium-dependent protein kinase